MCCENELNFNKSQGSGVPPSNEGQIFVEQCGHIAQVIELVCIVVVLLFFTYKAQLGIFSVL